MFYYALVLEVFSSAILLPYENLYIHKIRENLTENPQSLVSSKYGRGTTVLQICSQLIWYNDLYYIFIKLRQAFKLLIS